MSRLGLATAGAASHGSRAKLNFETVLALIEWAARGGSAIGLTLTSVSFVPWSSTWSAYSRRRPGSGWRRGRARSAPSARRMVARGRHAADVVADDPPAAVGCGGHAPERRRPRRCREPGARCGWQDPDALRVEAVDAAVTADVVEADGVVGDGGIEAVGGAEWEESSSTYTPPAVAGGQQWLSLMR